MNPTSPTTDSISDTDIFPAIYDFSILPYALGDVLTWNVKTCIKATEAEKKEIDIYVCADRIAPASIHQKKHINSDNYQLHLYELLPAFFCNPMLRNVYLHFDRRHFAQVIEKIPITHEIIRESMRWYRESLEQGFTYYQINKTLKEGVSSHEDINRFYSEKKYIPKLIVPRGCDKDVETLCQRFEASFLVTVNFRLRRLDKTLGSPELHRDSDFSVWLDFMKTAQRKFPNVIFLLLGKVQEKPTLLYQLDNVLSPRLCGFNLGHELALMLKSDLFMGSSSGFAAMANFTDVPYLITRVNEGACRNYGIPLGEKQLPFAKENQILSYEPETVASLLSHLAKAYKAKTPNLDLKEETDPEETKKWRTSTLFGPVPEVSNEISLYVESILQRAQVIAASQNYTGALMLLDQTLKEYPKVTNNMPYFHFLRATNLYFLGRFQEAKEAVEKELLIQPLVDQISHFRDTIDLVMRERGIS